MWTTYWPYKGLNVDQLLTIQHIYIYMLESYILYPQKGGWRVRNCTPRRARHCTTSWGAILALQKMVFWGCVCQNLVPICESPICHLWCCDEPPPLSICHQRNTLEHLGLKALHQKKKGSQHQGPCITDNDLSSSGTIIVRRGHHHKRG